MKGARGAARGTTATRRRPKEQEGLRESKPCQWAPRSPASSAVKTIAILLALVGLLAGEAFAQDPRPTVSRQPSRILAPKIPVIRGEGAPAPRETFESGLRKTVRWYLDNRWWWERGRSGAYRGERLGLVGPG